MKPGSQLDDVAGGYFATDVLSRRGFILLNQRRIQTSL